MIDGPATPTPPATPGEARALPARAPWRGATVAAAVFLLGLGFSAAAALWLHDIQANNAEAQFQRMTERAGREITRRYRQPIYGLHGARGLYAVEVDDDGQYSIERYALPL